MENKLEEFFYNKPKRHLIHKWEHYFEIYNKHFSKFQNKNPTILEIGVQSGGSLDMWNYYFDSECTIYGLDIDQNCKLLQKDFGDNVKIIIGDQGNPEFWDSFIKENDIMFDIIIDDGGHTMKQQITTFEKMYDSVKDGGIYLCEDTHTSYWDGYEGGFLKKGTFLEYSKNFIDMINAYHIKENIYSLDFRKKTSCISYYDSVVVLDKKLDNKIPFAPKKF